VVTDFLRHIKEYTKVKGDGEMVQGKVLLIMDLAWPKDEGGDPGLRQGRHHYCLPQCGTTSWMQWVDVYGAGRMRSLMFKEFNKVENKPTTAAKRRELVNLR
jgi:hypothetical protein